MAGVTVERMARMRERVRSLLNLAVEEARPQGRPPENERGTFIAVGRPDSQDKVIARLRTPSGHGPEGSDALPPGRQVRGTPGRKTRAR